LTAKDSEIIAPGREVAGRQGVGWCGWCMQERSMLRRPAVGRRAAAQRLLQSSALGTAV